MAEIDKIEKLRHAQARAKSLMDKNKAEETAAPAPLLKSMSGVLDVLGLSGDDSASSSSEPGAEAQQSWFGLVGAGSTSSPTTGSGSPTLLRKDSKSTSISWFGLGGDGDDDKGAAGEEPSTPSLLRKQVRFSAGGLFRCLYLALTQRSLRARVPARRARGTRAPSAGCLAGQHQRKWPRPKQPAPKPSALPPKKGAPPGNCDER